MEKAKLITDAAINKAVVSYREIQSRSAFNY